MHLGAKLEAPGGLKRDCLQLSLAQQGIWFVHQLAPGLSAYNVHAALRLDGPIDVPALKYALNQVTGRHEALRTTFEALEGRPIQRIAPAFHIELPVVDMARYPAEAREAAARVRAEEEVRRPFDLSRGPLLRALMLRLEKQAHLLVLTLHELVFDPWSEGALFEEISAHYTAFVEGRPCALPDPKIQYADYAVWQREQLGAVLETQKEYWRERLRDLPPLLTLPTDYPRPAVQSFDGAHYAVDLPAPLSAALELLSRREGATLEMTLLAAFAVLLNRCAEQDDLAIGVPVANRSREEWTGLIGLFLNTLVMRVDLSGDPPFRELLGRVRKVVLEARLNEALPLEKVVEAVRPERDAGHQPLFQVMFSLSEVAAVPELPGIRVTRQQIESGTAELDLLLFILQDGGRLTASFEYNTGLFTQATILRLAGHLQTLLEGIATNPEERIGRLPLLTEAERREVLVEWNDTHREYPQDRCVHELIAERARQTADALAVVQGERALTYGELDRRASVLARVLRSLGVEPEVMVGICMERSLETVAAVLGVLKAGGAFVPIDPRYPAHRLARTLGETRAPVLLSQKSLRGRFEAVDIRVLCLDTDEDEIEARRLTGGTGTEAGLNNLAYVIYTSGATGEPKGVMVEHGSLLNLVLAAVDEYGLGAPDRVLQFAQLSFDSAVEEIFSILVAGGTLVLPPNWDLVLPDEFWRTCHQADVTMLSLPTVFWHELVADMLPRPPCLPPKLRLVSVGGERALPEMVARWHSAVQGRVRLINGYGPTETTVEAAWGELSPWQPIVPGHEVPIGRPLPNVQTYVLDRSLAPVPVGVPGELFVGGAGVARGYLGRPELTAERFIPDLFRGASRGRLYRTGDRVRWLPDGRLEFLGRMDQQVKVRGFRVELGEIEAALAGHPRVREAVVLLKKDKGGNQRLVGYVTSGGATEPTEDDLRRHLAEKLPAYMIPSAFVIMETFPMTGYGKVDRRALPEPEVRPRPVGNGYIAPRDPLESRLARVWEEELGVSMVGIRDSFFSLGGDSLLAVRLMVRIEHELGRGLPLAAIFQAATVEGQARLLRHAEATDGTDPPPITPAPREGDPPLSFEQMEFWCFERQYPGTSSYNYPVSMLLTGPLNTPALAQALNEVVRRHELLRTTFDEVDGRAVQRIAPRLDVGLPVIDLSGLPAECRENAAQARAAEEAWRPFDLARGPLIRALLLRLDGEASVFVLTLHHIIFDGWSRSVLFRELSEGYAAFVEGRPMALARPKIQYPDYAIWQRKHMGKVFQAQIDFQRERLRDLPPALPLPRDCNLKPSGAYRALHHAQEIPAPLPASLDALSREEGATSFMTLLSAFAVLLYQYTGRENIVIYAPSGNRARREIEGMIGPFLGALVLSIDLTGNPPFRELLARVRELAAQAYEHQNLPFVKLLEALPPDCDPYDQGPFQVMFAMQNYPETPLSLAGVDARSFEVKSETAVCDLSLYIWENNGRLTAEFEYSADVFTQVQADRLAGHFGNLIEAIAANPDERIARLARAVTVPPASRQQCSQRRA